MAADSQPGWKHEQDAFARGFTVVAGVDEAGRGSLAGPVVAACVVIPAHWDATGINDSKKLSPAAREQAYDRLRASGAAIGVGSASHSEITEANILRATHIAMRRAIEACPVRPECLLIDGRPVPLLPMPSVAIVRGDAVSISIAAASIVAKVTRDRMMNDLAILYPHYRFDVNKGYPTPEHLEALRDHGPCPIHRAGFAPVKAAAGLLPGQIRPSERAETGAAGEQWAVVYLERLGHKILATRYRAHHAEIDIVSLDGSSVVFTEVKSSRRARTEPPAAMLSAAQQERIGQAAELFLAEHQLLDHACRFDVIEVVIASSRVPRIRHHRAAYILEPRPNPSHTPQSQ